jgi:phosphoribosylanthranilate isomerase
MSAFAHFILVADAIQNLTDARYFSAYNFDWMGFQLDPTDPEALPLVQVKAIMPWLSGPSFYGSFGPMQRPEEILALAEELALERVQVGQFFPKSGLLALSSLKLMQHYVVESLSDFVENLPSFWAERADVVECLVLDFARNGLKPSDLDAMPEAKRLLDLLLLKYPKRILLHWTWSKEEDLLRWKDGLALGFVFRGGAEERVGYKSFDDLDPFMELILGE